MISKQILFLWSLHCIIVHFTEENSGDVGQTPPPPPPPTRPSLSVYLSIYLSISENHLPLISARRVDALGWKIYEIIIYFF